MTLKEYLDKLKLYDHDCECSFVVKYNLIPYYCHDTSLKEFYDFTVAGDYFVFDNANSVSVRKTLVIVIVDEPIDTATTPALDKLEFQYNKDLELQQALKSCVELARYVEKIRDNLWFAFIIIAVITIAIVVIITGKI